MLVTAHPSPVESATVGETRDEARPGRGKERGAYLLLKCSLASVGSFYKLWHYLRGHEVMQTLVDGIA